SPAVTHEPAVHVPKPFPEPADRFDHQYPRPLRKDDLGDASDHRGVNRAFHEWVDIAPLEDRVPTQPLFRMVIQERLSPQDAVLAEVHHAIRLRRKWERLADAGEPELAPIANQVDLAVRLDGGVVAGGLPTHATAAMLMRGRRCARAHRRRRRAESRGRGA